MSDEAYMERAMELARRGSGLVSPNPMVGAVVVADDAIVGEGSHGGPGLPHAEVLALDRAGERARGATLFTSLEPCDHYGRTPPCTDAIVRAGIARVVSATRDPNPVVDGQGVRSLRAHGVEYVLVGGLASAAHGSRITMDDVDIAIPPNDDLNLANLGLALRQLGAEPVGELAAHRSSYDTSAGRLDIIELGEAYGALDEHASDEDLGNGIIARVASMGDLMELKRESGDLAAAAHLAALAHDGGSESEFDDPVEDREWPEWMNRIWNRFENVDAYLTRVVYGDSKTIHS